MKLFGAALGGFVPVEKIDLIEDFWAEKDDDFSVAVSAAVKKINEQIIAYNQLKEPEKGKEHIQNIKNLVDELDSKFNLSVYQKDSNYKKVFYEKLYPALQTDASNKSPLVVKFEQLDYEVLEHACNEVITIRPDKAMDNPFFTNNDASYRPRILSNGNTINVLFNPNLFVIKDASVVSQVLRIDKRSGMSTSPFHRAKQIPALQSVLVVPEFSRRIMMGEGERAQLAEVTLVPYFSKGSLDATRKKKFTNAKKAWDDVFDYYSQMATVFQQMNEHDVFFPDSKNSNWVIDNQGELRIVDNKSLLTTENGVYKGKGDDLMYTMDFIPPEYNDVLSNEFNADKAHAYLLGKNLKKFIEGLQGSKKNEVGMELPSFLTPTRAVPSDSPTTEFLNELNADTRREQYEALAEELTQDDPSKRPSVAEALKRIQEIQTPSVEMGKFNAIQKELENDVGNDAGLQDYLKEARKNFINQSAERGNILQEMRQLASFHKAIHKVNRNLNNRFFFSDSAKEKAQKINDIVNKLSIPERLAIVEQHHKSDYQKLREPNDNYNKLMTALNEHRILKFTTGETSSFKKFKDTVQSMREKETKEETKEYNSDRGLKR